MKSDLNESQVQADFTSCGVTKPVPLRVTLDRDGKCEIYGDLSSEHPDLGVTHSVPFVQMSDSARTRLNLCMVAKRVAVAQTS